ncbi:S1 family peptidase [Streptomyces sp. NBC_01210]|uniref:hypothetical protein n=1 Tax=Streptomyces sp. NBC_01210 TaxID=2903774 RepID=UPI002E1621F9|nr:S1 family peptidase [Streptomyces sp. NBC_01210]
MTPAPGIRLDNTIFTGDRESSTKTSLVKGTATPGNKDYVCVSGSFTAEVCKVKVVTSKPRCFTFRLRTTGEKVRRCGLMMAQKAEHRVSYPGDSGGPVYQHTKNGLIRAVGTIVGGYESRANTPFPEHDIVYYRPIEDVLRHQNAELQICGPADICD